MNHYFSWSRAQECGSLQLDDHADAGVPPFQPFQGGSSSLAFVPGVVAGDFNGDGRIDLAVANQGGNTVSVLLGNGDGTFQPQVTYAVGSNPTASWRATSTATAAPTSPSRTRLRRTRVSVLLGNGDGTLPAPGHLRASGGPQLDRGGRLQRRRPHRPRRRKQVGQHRVGAAGQRRRHVPAAGHLPAGERPIAIVTGDFNGDGRTRPRRHESTRRQPTRSMSVLLGNGDGTFQPQVTYADGGAVRPLGAIVAGDFNGDGRTDLAVVNAVQRTACR